MAVIVPYSALRGSRSGALNTLLFIRAKADRAASVSLPGGSGGCCRARPHGGPGTPPTLPHVLLVSLPGLGILERLEGDHGEPAPPQEPAIKLLEFEFELVMTGPARLLPEGVQFAGLTPAWSCSGGSPVPGRVALCSLIGRNRCWPLPLVRIDDAGNSVRAASTLGKRARGGADVRWRLAATVARRAPPRLKEAPFWIRPRFSRAVTSSSCGDIPHPPWPLQPATPFTVNTMLRARVRHRGSLPVGSGRPGRWRSCSSASARRGRSERDALA